MPEKARVGYIDALKGFAILCVVVGHAANGYMNAGMYSDTSFLSDLHNAIHTFHMPLFFVVSGFVFGKAYLQSNSKDKNWTKWHVFDFLSVYMLHSVLVVLTQILFSRYVNGDGYANGVASLSMIAWLPVKPFGVFWYFYTLSQLYVIFSIRRIYSLPSKWMLLLLTVISLIGTNWISASIWFHFRSLCYYMFFFYLGILLCTRREYWIFKKEIIWLAAAAAFVLCILYWLPECTINNIPTVNFIVAFGFSMLIFVAFRKYSVLGNCKILKHMGNHTLEIYLFHTYFTSGFRQIDRIFRIENVYLSIFINSIIGVLAPVCIVQVLNRMKLAELVLKPASFLRKKI